MYADQITIYMISYNLRPLSKWLSILCCVLISVVLSYGCKQPANKPVKRGGTIVNTDTATNNAVPVVKTTTDTAVIDDCPRGAAEPIVKKNVFPDTHFALQADHKTGIETLTLPTGDKLIIKQYGCEYYNLNFRFETSRYEADTTNIAYWSNAALLLLRQASKGLHSPLEISMALEKLSARLENDKTVPGHELAIGEEIDFGGPDPRQYLSLDRITQLPNKQYAVEIQLSYGPI
jgi:hypothetical protein